MIERPIDQLTQDELDDLVHDAKSEEASSINNEGRAAQIEYLRGIGWLPNP